MADMFHGITFIRLKRKKMTRQSYVRPVDHFQRGTGDVFVEGKSLQPASNIDRNTTFGRYGMRELYLEALIRSVIVDEPFCQCLGWNSFHGFDNPSRSEFAA